MITIRLKHPKKINHADGGTIPVLVVSWNEPGRGEFTIYNQVASWESAIACYSEYQCYYNLPDVEWESLDFNPWLKADPRANIREHPKTLRMHRILDNLVARTRTKHQINDMEYNCSVL